MFRTIRQHIAIVLTLFLGAISANAQDTILMQWGSYSCNSTLMESGRPMLPVVRWLMEIDGDGAPWIETFEDTCFAASDSQTIAPWQPSRFKNDPIPPYVRNEKVYGRDDFFASSLIQIEDLGRMRHRRIARVTFCPTEYNPVKNILKVHDCRLVLHGLRPLEGPLMSPEESMRIIAVVPDAYRESINPLIAWKQRLGYEVEVIGGTQFGCDSLRALLQQRYSQASSLDPAPGYILLVGDVDKIAPFDGRACPAQLDNHYTDLYFGEFTQDWLPDAIVGRLSAADAEELSQVVAKTIRYEQGLDDDTARSRQLLAVAGAESQAPAPIVTNGAVRYLSERFAAENWDTLVLRNPESDQLQDSLRRLLSQGQDLVAYTGHCTRSGWLHPTLASTDDGAPYPRLFVNNCCLSNDFHSTCFGERMLRKPSGGAIGAIGATNETLWMEDYVWSVGAKEAASHPSYDPLRRGAFDHLLEEQLTQGGLLLAGNLAVTESGSTFDHFYWETYCLLGDPTLQPHLQPLQDGWIACLDTLRQGAVTIRFRGTPGARVSVTSGQFLLGSQRLDSSGCCSVPLSIPLTGDSLTATLSAPGIRPCSISLFPLRTHSDIILESVILADSLRNPCSIIHGSGTHYLALAISVPDTLTDQRFALEQDSSDLARGALAEWIGSGSLTIDTLVPVTHDTLWFPFRLIEAGSDPILSLRIRHSHDSAEYWTIPLQYPCRTARPRIAQARIYEGGIPTKQLEAGHSYTILATLDDAMQIPFQAAYASISIIAHPQGDTLATLEDSLRQGESVQIPFILPDSASHLLIAADIHYGRHTESDRTWILVGKDIEDWESETLMIHPWQTAQTNGWRIDTLAHNGHFSLRSGPIGDNQQSILKMDIETMADDTIGFWIRTSCQSRNDHLAFSIDGVEKQYWSGQKNWTRWKTRLAQGPHILQWSYVKDASLAEGEDCVWIDDIRLPMSCWTAPYGTPDTASSPAEPLNIPDAETLGLITISPNPASSYVRLHNNTGRPVEAVLYDMYGRAVDRLLITSGQDTQYPTADLRLGCYAIKAGRQTLKLIITR